MNAPEHLGPYRLGESLGRGGMGSVFVGVHEKSGERVAVKLIAEQLSDEKRFRRRFDAEVETLKRLRHEGIVRLIGYGEENGQLFYSMELVEGEPLQKRIRREKRMDWMAVIEIAIQICAALKHAHDLGVIHRDLKPANLLLTANDGVKLVDFGIAKLFGYGEQTAAGSILGTADYMAPEQASNSGITSRTDLYALGSVMYAMLAGRPPFKGKRITDVIVALERDKPAPLEMFNLEIPEALVELVHEMLEKDPKDRPPTALAVMNRLKAMQAGLMREQTLNAQRGDTMQGISSESAMAIDPSSMAGSNTSSRKDGDTAGNVTKQPQAINPGDPGTVQVNPSAGTVQQRQSAPTDATLAANDFDTRQGVSDDESDDTNRSTHFQTVESEPSRSAIFRYEDTASQSKLIRGLSISVLVGLLLLGVVVMSYAFKKTSPESLYNEIVEINSTGSMADARPQIDRFMKLFPDHERYDEVKAMDMSLQLSGVIRRLQLQSKLPGRTLDAHEEALIDAMELGKRDSDAGREKLQQWMNVFVDATTRADDPRSKLAELVQFEIDRLLQQGPLIQNDSRHNELMARIDAAETLGTAEQRALLVGVIELYADEPWAESAVKKARQKLSQIDAGRDSTPNP
ncbi:MAG: serine/threonine protein kinase [Pirellulaceae bacterium]|nr:serine/threonine protein kinase [Pirellulaceae bacterium]